MNMTGSFKVKHRVLATITITAFVVFGLMVLGVNVSPVFVPAAIVSAIVGAIALMSIACPKCGHTVLYQELRLFGYRWRGWSAFPIPKVCRNCGHHL